jgi:6,7-dimethyl-8-ribityllumazine synthase
MTQELVGNFNGANFRVGIVSARFNGVVVDRLEEGAIDCFRRHGVAEDKIFVVGVPGAFEIPTAARFMFANDRVDGVVGLGCIIRGETAHYDYVCDAAVGGLAAIGRETGLPVTVGVLTTENLDQALQRAGGKVGHKGFESAQALLEMIDLTRTLAS